jgi:nitroreductase
MREITKVIVGGNEYTKIDIKKMDEVSLRGLLHERVHHNIEVPLYNALLNWTGKPISGFGMQAQIVFDVWQERGYTEEDPDIKWCQRYLDIAAKIRAGEKPKLDEPLPKPFSEEEMAVVHKLIWGRRSIRNWVDKEVPDEMIEKILEAGRAAPTGCNLDTVRFIVIRDPEEAKMVWSDISTENAVLIVICYDKRPSHVVGQDRPEAVPQNRGFDCAAAGDHMLLMAHALGLGGCWLTKREETAKRFKEQYGLPDNIEIAMHIAVGWPAMGTIKSARVPLKYMMIRRNATE